MAPKPPAIYASAFAALFFLFALQHLEKHLVTHTPLSLPAWLACLQYIAPHAGEGHSHSDALSAGSRSRAGVASRQPLLANATKTTKPTRAGALAAVGGKETALLERFVSAARLPTSWAKPVTPLFANNASAAPLPTYLTAYRGVCEGVGLNYDMGGMPVAGGRHEQAQAG